MNPLLNKTEIYSPNNMRHMSLNVPLTFVVVASLEIGFRPAKCLNVVNPFVCDKPEVKKEVLPCYCACSGRCIITVI